MYRNGPQIPMREGGGGGQAHVVLADAFSVMLVNIQVTTYFTTEFTADFPTIHLSTSTAKAGPPVLLQTKHATKWQLA